MRSRTGRGQSLSEASDSCRNGAAGQSVPFMRPAVQKRWMLPIVRVGQVRASLAGTAPLDATRMRPPRAQTEVQNVASGRRSLDHLPRPKYDCLQPISHGRLISPSAPGRTQTCDPRLRRSAVRVRRSRECWDQNQAADQPRSSPCAGPADAVRATSRRSQNVATILRRTRETPCELDIRETASRGKSCSHAAVSCEPMRSCESGRRASNPRPSAWEADALPTELRPRGRSRGPLGGGF